MKASKLAKWWLPNGWAHTHCHPLFSSPLLPHMGGAHKREATETTNHNARPGMFGWGTMCCRRRPSPGLPCSSPPAGCPACRKWFGLRPAKLFEPTSA